MKTEKGVFTPPPLALNGVLILTVLIKGPNVDILYLYIYISM